MPDTRLNIKLTRRDAMTLVELLDETADSYVNNSFQSDEDEKEAESIWRLARRIQKQIPERKVSKNFRQTALT